MTGTPDRYDLAMWSMLIIGQVYGAAENFIAAAIWIGLGIATLIASSIHAWVAYKSTMKEQSK